MAYGTLGKKNRQYKRIDAAKQRLGNNFIHR